MSRDGDELFVALRRQAVAALAPAPELVAELLAAPALALASAPVVASVGSPKLLVEVTDSATLHGLRPDLARIVAWGKGAGVNGCTSTAGSATASTKGATSTTSTRRRKTARPAWRPAR